MATLNLGSNPTQNLGFNPTQKKESVGINPLLMSSNGNISLPTQAVQIPAQPLTPPKTTSSQITYPQSPQQVSSSQSILAGVQESLKQLQAQAEQYKKEQEATQKPQALQEAEANKAGFFQQIQDKASKLLGIGQRRTELESQYGVEENTKKLQENQLQIASKLAEYESALKQIDSLNVAKPFQDIERNRAAKTYASEVGILEAYGNALRGNLELANNRIKQVLQNEYQSTQQEIDNLKLFYDINKDILSGEEKKYAEQINALAREQESQLKSKQANEKNNTELFLEVAKNGGSSSVVDFNLPYEENLKRAAPYIGALERQREARLTREDGIQQSVGFGSYKVEQDFRESATQLLDEVDTGKRTIQQAIQILRRLYSPQEVSDSAINSFFGITPFGDSSTADILLPGEFNIPSNAYLGIQNK
ncbi:MAG: hypothetical protein IPM48_14580 [Saprospiraceae bacterium]|nr:hypothetical protein [Saprospiraceae bacterium]